MVGPKTPRPRPAAQSQHQAAAPGRGTRPEGDRQHHRPRQPLVRGNGHTPQGYNAQVVAAADQVVVAAELTQQANDVQQLASMLAATTATLAAADIPSAPSGWRPTPATGRSPTSPPFQMRPSC
jgi:hypothetical protein